MKRISAALSCVALWLLAAAPASAQAPYPSRIVKLVVPFAAGGSTDLIARSYAEGLTELWKQTVIVENRGGAGGMLGSDSVAKSTPDGYTLLFGTVTTQAVAPNLHQKVPYDALRDFIPISELAVSPQLLSVNPAMPIRSVKELVAYAKSKPGELTHGNGTGSTAHMSMELFSAQANIKTLHIPYKGSGPTMIDLLAGQLNAGFDVLMTTLPHMKSGKLRTLAVTGAKRSPLAPDVPTVAEAGFPGFEASVWFGVFAPAGTPPEVVKKIGDDTRKVMLQPKMKEKFEANGIDIVASTPAEFDRRVKSDFQKWRKLIVDAKLKPE